MREHILLFRLNSPRNRYFFPIFTKRNPGRLLPHRLQIP
jgi:hypothetical protein